MNIYSARKLTWVAAVTLITVGTFPATLGAQVQSEASQTRRYILIDMGTLGGPNSYVYGADYSLAPGAHPLNKHGVLVGQADTAVNDPNVRVRSLA